MITQNSKPTERFCKNENYVVASRITCYAVLSLLFFGMSGCGDATHETPQPITATPPNENKISASAPALIPMAASAYSVEWSDNQIPTEMPAGNEQKISATIKNTGDGTWRNNEVLISYHWLPLQGENAIIYDGERTGFPHNIAPGETVAVQINILPPKDPGQYRLQLTLVQEGVTWFESKGATTLTAPVTVR